MKNDQNLFVSFRLAMLIVVSLLLTSCASKPSAIVFPEINFTNCPQGTERSPSNICRARLSDEKYKKWETIIRKFESLVEKSDSSKGKGLTNAALFLSHDKEPIRVGSSDGSFAKPNQVVSFYQPTGTYGSKTSGGAAVVGAPTRLYLTEAGKIAYMAFDKQAVSLLEVSNQNRQQSFSVISGQDSAQHAHGFSSPVGKIKKLADKSSQYSVEDLRIFLGKEGEAVTIEFESGVIVKGIVEKYTALTKSDENNRAVVVTFKDQTATVTYGVHTLFQPDWGVFDMLLMPEVSDSYVVLSAPPK